MGKGKKKQIFREISLDQIDRPPDIVRMEINEVDLRELADSIRDRGLLQPIEVTPRGDKYLIVFGDRRYLAHKLLGLKRIMCRVEEMEESQVVIDRAVENIQRVNLTPFEEGHIYVGLVEKGGFSLDAIAGMVGKSPGVVQRRIDILRMPECFQRALHARSISLSVAEELWSCPDTAKREYFLDLAVEHGITQQIARQWVQEFKKAQRGSESGTGEGRGAESPYEDVPIYRGCDVCRDPVEYKDVKELRVCPRCNEGILSVSKKEGR
jgi:ParB family chromosome partitioning protein